VDRVKRSESGMVWIPVTIEPERKYQEALDLMSRLPFPACLSHSKGKLVGILTSHDLRFETRYDQPFPRVMTRGKPHYRFSQDHLGGKLEDSPSPSRIEGTPD